MFKSEKRQKKKKKKMTESGRSVFGLAKTMFRKMTESPSNKMMSDKKIKNK